MINPNSNLNIFGMNECYAVPNKCIVAADDPATHEAIVNFVTFLNNTQTVFNMPDDVTDEMNRRASEVGRNALIYGFSEGYEAGILESAPADGKTATKPCSVDILGISLGEEGLLIIPREVRTQCEPLVNATNALTNALNGLPISTVDKNTIAMLAANLMAQAEQEGVKNGVEAYTDFTHDMTPEKFAELEASVKGDSMPS